MGMLECFESQFSSTLKSLAQKWALFYINRHKYESEFSVELYATKRTIIKVQRVNAPTISPELFSIHRRVHTKSHGAEYSWYFEKYVIDRRDPKKVKSALLRYGHYPYNWE